MIKKNENILRFLNELSNLTDGKFNFFVMTNNDNTKYQYLNICLEDDIIRIEFWLKFIKKWFGKNNVIDVRVEANKIIIEVELYD